MNIFDAIVFAIPPTIIALVALNVILGNGHRASTAAVAAAAAASAAADAARAAAQAAANAATAAADAAQAAATSNDLLRVIAGRPA